MSVQKRQVDLRCPNGPKALLGKMIASNEPLKITPDNLVELACRDCTKAIRRARPEIKRVVHRFDIIGELVETVYQRGNDDIFSDKG